MIKLKHTLQTAALFLSLLSLSALPQINFMRTALAMPEGQKIAVIVNEGAISSRDIGERMKMMISSSGLPNNEEVRNKLVGQVINNLVEEEIKLQEAKRLNIEVPQNEIQNGFKSIAAQNRIPPEKFMEMLKRSGFDESTMERQIRAQIAWNKVIASEIRPKIKVSEKDIDAALNRLKKAQGNDEYLLAEIYLPIEDANKEKDIKQLAEKLRSEIKAGKAPFFAVAQQFSKAAGATKGGDLGWVTEDQLSPEIAASLENLEINQVSKAIRTANGYHLIFLRQKRKIAEENIPTRDEISVKIGNTRLERMQHRHYLDLRANAFIESRV